MSSTSSAAAAAGQSKKGKLEEVQKNQNYQQKAEETSETAVEIAKKQSDEVSKNFLWFFLFLFRLKCAKIEVEFLILDKTRDKTRNAVINP